MSKIIHIFLMFITLFFFSIVLSPRTIATSAFSFETIEETAPPEDLSFTVRKTQTITTYVDHAVARDDGMVAILSRKGIDENKKPMLRHCFVALYHPDGTFDCELEFVTNHHVSMELTEDCLNFFLQNQFLIVFDLVTEEITYYSISMDREEGYELDAGKFRNKKFAVGEWTYSYKRNWWYSRGGLVRNNGQIEQSLLILPAPQFPLGLFVKCGALTFFAILYILMKRKQT